MKKIMGELRRPSLAIKWTLASSFFIFVIFTLFAIITYQYSVKLLIQKERENVEEVVGEVTTRLVRINSDVTVETVQEYLGKTQTDEEQAKNPTDSSQNPMIKKDNLPFELGQPALFLSVYNSQGTVVYGTQEEYTKLENKEEQLPQIEVLNGKKGFFLIQSIYAIDTEERIGYVQVFYNLSSFYSIQNRLLMTLIFLEIISLILISVSGVILSSYFLKPLKLLRDTMETIRKDPQSTVHTPNIHSNDELSDLAEIFNEMLDRMRRYIEQQEQFVEDVSHELRTPVAIIEGHLNLLNRWGKEDPAVLEESLETSLQEVVRMKSLVQEMLDLSRAEQVDIQYFNEVCQAKEVIYQVFNNFKLLYPQFTILLDDDLTEEVSLDIYRNHFEQLLIIILDNAIKYSTTRKEVHLSISKTFNAFELAIQDFGEGMDEEEIGKVFDRFYRVDKARNRKKGGNGLGLAIAKKLVENYKGAIHAESVPKQGTVFRINLPISQFVGK